MTRPRGLYVPFAGALGETLCLLGGRRLLPPCGYMGSKRAYGPAILGALGLHPGQGCDLALIVDAGPWGWAWQHLFQADTARSVAAQLRAWRGEDPVGLWRRLAAEPPPGDLIDGIATWLWLQARCANACPVWWDDTGWRMGDKPRSGGAKGAIQHGHHADPDHPHIQWGRRPAAPEPAVRHASREIRPKGTGRGTVRGMIDPGTIAARIEAIAHQFAAYLCLQAGAALSKPVVVRDGRWKTAGYGHISESARERGFVDRLRSDMIALCVDRLAELRAPAIVACHARAEDCVPQGDLDGWVAILDPPYRGATSYAADCPRETVLAMALDLRARGARVAVCEAEPLALPGWHHLDLTGVRSAGGPGSWSARRAKGEWLTLSDPPAARPVVQQALWRSA